MDSKRRLRARCRAPHCDSAATALCFECDRPFCADHLRRVRFTGFGIDQSFLVCPTCLDIYAGDPSLWPYLSLSRPEATPYRNRTISLSLIH